MAARLFLRQFGVGVQFFEIIAYLKTWQIVEINKFAQRVHCRVH